MKNKLLSSIVVTGLAFSGAQAVEVNAFGHIGGVYDQGLSNKNIPEGYTKKGAFGGATGHLGVDVGFGSIHIGAGAYSGVSIYKTKGMPNRYGSDYVDLSDLYLKYDSGMLQIAVGRFNNEFLGTDWLTAYTQGVGFKYQSRSIGVWATWMNDFTTYGYAPGRMASELASWGKFPSSFKSFDIGKRDIIAGGVNVNFGFLTIDPFVHYYRYPYDGKLQAGAKLGLIFGEDGSAFQSKTSLRYMWQNILGVKNDDSMLFWGDQEFVFGGIFKLGGGYFATTKSGISTVNNMTRFYGATFFTPYSGINGTESYFNYKTNTWYAFTGVKSQFFDLDVLYADGDYSEFSAIASVTIFDVKTKGSLNGIALKVGGGYVSNGFSKKRNLSLSNVVGFVKLSY
ncbi:hypothetical protein LW135_01020 [Helicobacter sp. faydin-H20]|uniref:hypothetical protein n=1 Tax=Helicobacter anatolicus TaxID=2905874 RepID=UPI001E4555AF|nr:hypothetical protein [Helicobacter anatolicus]MCE3036415.1 hypothetical protein [Helicobacter anatolicus]